uniref:Protein PLANT CADMIUM RESISTANCE 8 n=1 Tax=Anthurium amnicola TaxID=1678845 RepID=A0A1D1XZF9_9ARAE
MGRPRPNDAEPVYPPPDAQQGGAAYPQPMPSPVNPAGPGSAAPYPPPEQYPPATGQPLTGEYPQNPVQTLVIGDPWSSGLFDCHQHQTNAIMTAFFPCVTFGQIAEIQDAGQTSCTMGSLMYLMLAPALCAHSLLGSSYRAKMRQRYNLVQAPAEDWVLHLFCPCCSLCQEFRELMNRGIDPSLGYMGNLALQQKGTTMVPPQSQFMNQ